MIVEIRLESPKSDFEEHGISKEKAFEIIKNKAYSELEKALNENHSMRIEQLEDKGNDFVEPTYKLMGDICILRPEQVQYIDLMLSTLSLAGFDNIRSSVMNELKNK